MVNFRSSKKLVAKACTQVLLPWIYLEFFILSEWNLFHHFQLYRICLSVFHLKDMGLSHLVILSEAT